MSHFLTNQMAQIYQQKKKKFIAIWWPARAFASNKLCQHTHSYTLNAIPSNTKFSWFITTNTTKLYFLIHYNGQTLSSLSHFSPFSSITNPERKNPKIPTKHTHTHTHTQNPKKFKKVQKFSYKGRQYKELQKFLLSLSHSFSPTFVFV